jgi:hypothetical protein
MLDAVEPARRPAVVGIADHSGWANLVTVSLDGSGHPVVVDRRRARLVDDDLPRQPYHAALGLAAADAERLVARVTEAAGAGAERELAALESDLEGEHQVVGLVVRTGTDRPLPDTVAEVVANHSAMHAAEGELYRDVWADAAEVRQVGVALYPRNDGIGAAARVVGTTNDALAGVLAALGRELGPPWQKEHREAAAAAVAELSRHTSVALRH